MDTGNAPAVKRRRGRPKTGEKSGVAEKLLDAAEELLREYGHLNATERKIAAAAGVHYAMINYYFGNKEGLLIAVGDRLMRQIARTFIRLDEAIGPHHENPTRLIISMLIEGYYAKPWLARMMISETTRQDSVMKEWFIKRYGTRGMTDIRRVLDRMAAAGVYDSRVNTAHVALSMFSNIMAPFHLTLIAGPGGVTLDDIRKDDWIDYLTDLFDRQLRRR